MTLGEWLRAAAQDIPRSEARQLAQHVLQWNRAEIIARESTALGSEAQAELQSLLAARKEGTPLAYLLGEVEFYGRGFFVDPRVLIPRPDSETLIDVALALPLPASAKVLDIGTGSGCLAVTLAAERPDWQITATDISSDALAVAARNAARNEVDFEFILGDLYAPVAGRPFDLVLSNPPYIGQDEELPHEVRGFEPAQALFADNHGLGVYERLASESGLIQADFWIVEIGYLQAETVPPLFQAAGFNLTKRTRDLAGIERVQTYSKLV